MKKFILPFIATAVVLIMASCSEKFNVAAPYKDITVVYGFLDMNDTAHYIRIQKAFLDQDKSALNMAKTPDSSFYANISVRVERYGIAGKNVYHDSIHLNRVDLTTEGYPKEAGTFFESPNYAYKFTQPLDPQYFYRLKITNLTTGKIDSADAPIINEVSGAGVGFNVTAIDDPTSNLDGMSFFSVLQGRYYTLDGIYYTPPNYNYPNQTSPVGVVDAIIRFNWDDVNVNTSVHTPRYYDYDLGYNATTKGAFFYNIPNASLYTAIATGMGAAPANTYRVIGKCDISVYASTPDFLTYQQVTAIQGTGLTGSEIAPVATNIKGENALGLFTSRAYHTGKIGITTQTIDSLIASPLLSYTKLQRF